MTAPDIKEVQKALKSGVREQQLRAVATILQEGMQDGIPALIGALPTLAAPVQARVPNKAYAISILEALIQLAAPGDKNGDALKRWAAGRGLQFLAEVRWADQYPDFSAEEFQLNVALFKLMITLFQRFGTPIPRRVFSKETFPAERAVYAHLLSIPPEGSRLSKLPINLRYAIAIDELVSDRSQAETATQVLLGFLGPFGAEMQRWEEKDESGGGSGLGLGLLLGPFLGAFVAAFAASMAQAFAEGMARGLASQQAKSMKSSLLLSVESIDPGRFKQAPAPMCYLTALHAYATGFYKISVNYPDVVKGEMANCKEKQQKLALAYALAMNGDASIHYDLMNNGSRDTHWANRILGYEALISLANNPETAERVEMRDLLGALTDKDPRVCAAAAFLMARTQNPAYTPHLIKMADSSDETVRLIAASILPLLARGGNAPAYERLKGLAQTEKDKKIRESAQKSVLEIDREGIDFAAGG